MQECVLAVDGGNTKTIALVAALDGTILGTGRAGCGDIYNADRRDRAKAIDVAFSNIEHAVMTALMASHAVPTDLVAGVFGMAGADWPEDFTVLHAGMSARGFGRTILIQNDALGVLHAGTTRNVGVSLVCGTGSATGARGPDGQVWHSSFWQFGAEGGIQLADKMLEAVFCADLGIAPTTTLTNCVLKYFGLNTVEEVLHYLTAREQTILKHHVIGGLTPMLLDEAKVGDGVALNIVQGHGRALGRIAQVAARRVGIEGTAFPLVLAGGVLRHPSSLLPDAITEQLRTTSPEVQPVRSRFEPVIGVLFSALEEAGVTINDTVIERVTSTIPDAALFESIPIRD
ncbi:N-acetylglucosamine kinase [Reticulibacter mediterranei]|uniref:N-acetylglucosamine kinase n=1 Tax=Reticulibacter mediterranei TaxID=2778369 RepID=A0A8J3IKP7_9CHLR|nr:BadF/BadG/BcrA/BcrD ATPase family protein [Reticulibacter mediterranei]GHO91966.1 N-acetylglucosamine kinase [Reticulibacter mediterranei]